MTDQKQRHLDFLYELHRLDVDIGGDNIYLLRENNYIEKRQVNENDIYVKELAANHKKQGKIRRIKKDYSFKRQIDFFADTHIDIIDNKESVEQIIEPVKITDSAAPEIQEEKIIDIKEYKEEIKKDEHVYVGGNTIKTSDWKPQHGEVHNYPLDFVRWIDSINTGFDNRIQYKRFNLYVQQAQDWYSENSSINDLITDHEQMDFAIEEIRRIRQNTLYFLSKYLIYKEGVSDAGGHKYKAFDAHRILCFLTDCGYNLIIGKPRQLWFSTTMGGIAVKRTNFFKSHFIKFITENMKKGQEIFEDKIKFAFYHLPEWMKCTVNNDQEGLLRLLRKGDGVKGSIGGVDSKILVEAPYITAINGGSPDLIMIDEIGQIPILPEMVKEGRPTLFAYNHTMNRIEQKRQVLMWGTGGNMGHGGSEFEKEFMSAMEMWRERKFHHGIVPLFFDAYAKPGMTKEFYKQQEEIYLANGDDKSRTQFRQHYPLTIEDMFLTSNNTIVPSIKINSCLERIYSLDAMSRCKQGYFEPIYDTSNPYQENSYLPFKLIGTQFIPTEDGDPRATCTIFEHPKEKWINRYYQGTDPIFAESGHSKMSSAIWDSENNTVSAIVNYREGDYRYCYLQCACLGIYYSQDIKDLIEINVGKEYCHFKETYGYYRTIVSNKMLPHHLQTQTVKDGISKKANTAKYITNKHYEMIASYIDNIFIEEYFLQLKTFTRKTTEAGNETFKVENAKYYYDDVIDAIVYSYICAGCYAHMTPVDISVQEKKRKVKRYVCDSSTNYRTVLVEKFI